MDNAESLLQRKWRIIGCCIPVEQPLDPMTLIEITCDRDPPVCKEAETVACKTIKDLLKG